MSNSLSRIPLGYQVLHNLSSYHKPLLKLTVLLGCYYCKRTSLVSEVKEWIDRGNTALCPKCGIDSVLPDMGMSLDLGNGKMEAFRTTDSAILEAMCKHWFSTYSPV